MKAEKLVLYLVSILYLVNFVNAQIYSDCEIYGNCEPVAIATGSVNYSSANVNSSIYWDEMSSINTTQMENNNEILNIKQSWFINLFNILFGLKTTDDLSQGIINKYDNQSFNNTLTDSLYAEKKWGYNMSDEGGAGGSYNSTYNTWAYNMSSEMDYTDIAMTNKTNNMTNNNFTDVNTYKLTNGGCIADLIGGGLEIRGTC
jgi:hypothetical protein